MKDVIDGASSSVNKHILYISYDGMTDPLGQSQVLPYILGLVKKGYHFTLISFEKTDRYQKYGDQILALIGDQPVEWIPESFTARPPMLSKLYDVNKMMSRAESVIRRRKIHLIHCRSYVPAGVGLRLKKKYNIPVLFDMRGFWVDERVDNGQWKLANPFYKMLFNIYKKKEQQYFNKADHIISLTATGKEELIQRYHVPELKVTVIPCCVDVDHFDYRKIDLSAKDRLKRSLGISEDQQVLTYLGSLGGTYLTGEMLAFFVSLKKRYRDAKFLFITPTSEAHVLEAVASVGLRADDIVVRSSQRKDVPLYLSLSTWSIFFYEDNYSRKACSPTKQGEIMAMGLPFICNDIGDTGNIVKISKAGMLVKEFSSSGYDDVISQMDQLSASDPSSIRNEAVRFFDLSLGIERYWMVYQKLI